MKLWIGRLEDEHIEGQATAKAHMQQVEADLVAKGAPTCKHNGCTKPASGRSGLCFTHGIL
jgi:hypothetical protein